jgi:predicted RNase H-like HicB family nuclease
MPMLLSYIQAAMNRGKYEILADNEGFYGEVPDLRGVWANAPTLEACRQELQEVLESWIVIKLRHGDKDFPVLDGFDLNVTRVEDSGITEQVA